MRKETFVEALDPFCEHCRTQEAVRWLIVWAGDQPAGIYCSAECYEAELKERREGIEQDLLGRGLVATDPDYWFCHRAAWYALPGDG